MTLSSNRDDWCKHRTPFDRAKFPTCKVGVDYHEFGMLHATIPCLGGDASTRCEKFTAWTEEEKAARKRNIEERFGRIGLIRSQIVAVSQSENVFSGTMSCPACKSGTVSWSMARSNGHVHARCSTPDCASWME